MNLAEKILFLMQRKEIKTVAELSRALDIPYKTLDNILRRTNFDNVKFSILKKLCLFFDVNLMYLIFDEITDPDYGMLPTKPADVSLYPDEQQLIEDYRSLTPKWQEHIRITMEVSKVSCQRELAESAEKHA